MHPAKYTRLNQKWSRWLDKTGTVVASTYIMVAGKNCSQAAPYSYAIIKFDQHLKELMGVGHERLEAGDQVRCVLRKGAGDNGQGLIEYQLKVEKI